MVIGNSKRLDGCKATHCVLGSGALSQPVGVWVDPPEVAAFGLGVEGEGRVC